MNKPLLIALVVGALGVAGIAVMSTGGSDPGQPVRVGLTRPNIGDGGINGSSAAGLPMIGDSRASLRSVNQGSSFANYGGPLAAETPDRFDESLSSPSNGSENSSGGVINRPRTNPNRPDANDRGGGRADDARQRAGQQSSRPGAGGGAGAGGPGVSAPALANPAPPMPPSGPTGPDLSGLPPGLIIPDGLPQSVIDVLIDAANRGVFDGGGGGGSGGGGSGGGGGAGGGGGGSGGGGSGGGGGGGGVIIGGGGGSDGPQAQLVWVDAPISGCSNLSGQRTRDLYIRLTVPARVLSVDSGVGSPGMTIAGAGFTQVSRAPNPIHTPPSQFEILQNPCAEFDTYLAFGPANPAFLGGDPIYDPTLNAQWFGILVQAAQNPSLFGDNAYYLRLGRFTAPDSQVTIGGQITVATAPAGGGLPVNRSLTVPSWSEPNGGLDDGDDDDGGSNGGGGDDGTDGPDGDGGDDGDGGGDGGGGGGDGDDGDDDGPTGDVSAITLVWHEVDNGGCTADVDGDMVNDIDLTTARTFDLLMRSPTPDRLIGAATGTGGASAFSVVVGGPIIQFPGVENSNTLPSAADIAAEPCLEFDTYLAVGTSPDVMFLSGEPDPDSWPTFLSTEWVTDATVIAQQDSSTFGDNAYYARLMRLTVGGASSIVGEVRLTVVPAGFSSAVQTLPLAVPALP